MSTGTNNSVDTCSICTEKFNNPKLLPCFHSFCLECLRQYVSLFAKNGQFPCPLCRRQITVPREGVATFQTNFYIEGRSEKQSHSGSRFCEVCEQIATHSCFECEMLLCDVCTKGHQIVPVTRTHLLVNLGNPSTDGSYLPKQTFCDKHKDEKQLLYCMACNKVVCRVCKLAEHEGHKIKNITYVVEDARTSLKKSKVQLKKSKAKIEKSIDGINKNRSERSKRINQAKEEINKLADSLVDMINKARIEELERVTEMEKTHVKKCSDERRKLTERKCFIQNQIDEADAMLKKGFVDDLLTVGIEKRLSEIQNQPLLDSVLDCESLEIPNIPSITPGVLDVVGSAVRNKIIHAVPVLRDPVSLDFLERVRLGSVHSLSLTKHHNVLVSYEDKFGLYLGLFERKSSEPKWKFRITLKDLVKEGVHGVIAKHNKENPHHKISEDDYVDLKKPFPYKDTNDNGDTCWVIKGHNWVGIQTASGVVRTLTFNPFAKPGQEFRPVDVCWGVNQEICCADSAAGMIVMYSVQHGFQTQVNNLSFRTLTALTMDADGTLWVGNSLGQVTNIKIVCNKK